MNMVLDGNGKIFYTSNASLSHLSKTDRIIIIAITVLFSLLNMRAYTKDTSYIWVIDYRTDNEMIANAITEEYPNVLYASERTMRGYMNLLFGRETFEHVSVEDAAALAVERQNDQLFT